MAKTRTKITSRNGSVYEGALKNGKVRVTTTRTARGQILIEGIYDVTNREWSKNNSLPRDVREHIETAFA